MAQEVVRDLRPSASINTRTRAAVLPRCHATNKSQVAPSSVIGTMAALGIFKCLTNIGFTEMASSLPEMARLSAMPWARWLCSFIYRKREVQAARGTEKGQRTSRLILRSVLLLEGNRRWSRATTSLSGDAGCRPASARSPTFVERRTTADLNRDAEAFLIHLHPKRVRFNLS
jgi:hypothetical protein